jgi:hypothetical protein
MCDKATDAASENNTKSTGYGQNKFFTSVESNLVYELKKQREYFLRKLVDIQKAIDAINQI